MKTLPRAPDTSRTPVISVGMPAYNSQTWIESSIISILRQTTRDLELIISDNASTDNTLEICERFARVDSRVRVYKNSQNIGANRNYRNVLNLARAPYFKWASSNDLCDPTFLEKCIHALENDTSAVLAFSQVCLFEASMEDAQAYSRDLPLLSDRSADRFKELFATMGLNNAFNGVIRRQSLLTALPLGNYQRADIVLMAELALMGKFLLVDERLFFRRMSRETATKLQAAREVDRHLEPRASKPLRWQNWLFFAALIQVCLRQRPFTKESLKALLHVGKQLRWSWNDLVGDVRRALTRSTW